VDRKRLSLAIILINRPDLLIFGYQITLDLEMIEWLEAILQKKTVVYGDARVFS
jgi:ATP-binding cassette subfamily F protein uup